MEITEEKWNELVNKVSGFEAQIEELKTQNSTLTSTYEAKLNEWQIKLNDQQKTIDNMAKQSSENKGNSNNAKKAQYKSVRYDATQDKLIFEE